MKNVLLFAFLLVSAVVFSQQTTQIGDFNELKVYDLITVKLVPADENKVEVTGFNADYVKIINDNGVLKIRMELEERFDGNATNVTVYFKNISVLDANEGAHIFSEAAMDSISLELRAQEGAKIDVKAAVNSLYIKSVSGGIINVEGTAIRQDITINSGGVYNGEKLISTEADISVTAGGAATLHTTNRIDAKVTAGGSIKVYGNPEHVKKKRLAGGNIEIVKGK
tara:strand:- start:250 stop:924 length:675 start_codon:yes stop_codon:yes gene_type:complete